VRPDPRARSATSFAFLEEDSNGWLVTFSDLVLQLFAFVLVAAVLGGGAGVPAADGTATPRPRPASPAPARASFAASAAIEASPIEGPDALSLARFDDLPQRVALAEARDPTSLSAAPAVARETLPVLRTEDAPAVRIDPPVAEPASLPAPIAPATSLAAELESFVIAEGLEEVVQVAVNGGGVTLSISDTIGFASGSAELLPDAAPVLAEVRSLVAARTDLVVEVAGHTDDRPVHAGVFQSNLDLSLARAARVAHELAVGDAELTTRIFAAGYGAQRPVAPNLDAEGRARNRRVELRLVPGHDVAAEPPLVREPRLAAR
jgi:chemotaxis protein MotB